jgi:hypothetical protein
MRDFATLTLCYFATLPLSTLKTFNFMTITDFYDFCRAKAGVTEHFPFDEDTLVT